MTDPAPKATRLILIVARRGRVSLTVGQRTTNG
jgi:hypothetical protein